MRRTALAGLILFLTAAAPAGAQPREAVAETIHALEAARPAETVIHTIAANPNILVYDLPTLAEQGRMFNRAVALVERDGAPRDRVLTDAELAEFIRSVGRTATTFAFGNDFPVSQLARFFNLAADGGVELTAEEVALRDFLLAKGFMTARHGFYQFAEPERVILSIPAEQGDSAITASVRRTILHHELGHGEFFSNPAYAAYCAAFWKETLTEEERQAFRRFLASRNYDARDEALMINEMQAYLLHTPDPAVFSADKVKLPPDRVERLRRAFWAGNPPTTLFAGTAPATQ